MDVSMPVLPIKAGTHEGARENARYENIVDPVEGEAEFKTYGEDIMGEAAAATAIGGFGVKVPNH
eukprot:8410056-Alexandrium_andersonii.AAC.1